MVDEIPPQKSFSQQSAYCESVIFDTDRFYLNLYFEAENIWKWTVVDINNRIIYEKYRTYPGGHSMEIWDGVTNSGQAIPPGVFVLKIYNQNNRLMSEKRFIVS